MEFNITFRNMKLMSVVVNGYRRLKNKTSMNLDGKLIAIVGANEAGKSSFLEALQHLNNTTAFVKTGASQEISRGLELLDTNYVIEARYLIEDADRLEFAHIEDTKKVKWFNYYKAVNGHGYYSVDPRPLRDLKHRKNILKSFQKAIQKLDKFEKTINENDEDQIELAFEVKSEIEKLSTAVDVPDESLSIGTLERMHTLAEKMRSSGIAADVEFLQTVAKELEELGEKESKIPAVQAMAILNKLRPEFLLFDEESRGLESVYDPIAIGTEPPQALDNLLKLAKLDLSKLQQHIRTQDQGEIRTLIDEANEHLKNVFEVSWSQSNIYVYLDVNTDLLHILIKEQDRSYVKIAERSDGLRQYIALLSFVALHKDEQKPILLIDEAETHLHYDAQADLVQMLTRQTEVDQVIYTTHSIGCLPEDLGIGVRLIAADSASTSVIKNWFWVSDKPGFSPLLFGMGASTMAFMPVRYALVTEGITDTILLPSLLREATKKEYLGFQIVSGLSETSKGNFSLLENGSPSTTYLLDADKGGEELRKQLLSAGIKANRIFSLPDKAKIGLVLEDFINKEVYLTAVNEELQRQYPAYKPLSLSDLPEVNRPAKVKDWCKNQGIKEPSKRTVAYRVLEQKTDRRIVEKTRQKDLNNLYNEIQKALSIPQI